MAMTSNCTNQHSDIKFYDLTNPLPDDLNNIRNMLKNCKPFQCDHDSTSLLFSQNKQLNITHGTAILLDSLLIPYYTNMFERFNFIIEYYDDHTSSDDDGHHEEMIYEFSLLMGNLIKWRRNEDGSIVFVTKHGEVSPSDIGVEIAQSDLNDFYKIAAG